MNDVVGTLDTLRIIFSIFRYMSYNYYDPRLILMRLLQN